MGDNPFTDVPDMLQETGPDNRSNLLLRTEVRTDIDLNQSKVDFDYRKEIDRMAADATKGSQLGIDSMLPDDMLGGEGLVDVDLLLLQQAERHIKDKEYALALAKLDAFLAKKFQHPEALYLRALCLASQEEADAARALAQQISARRALAPLLSKTRMPPLSRALQERVEALRLRIQTNARNKILILFLTVKHDVLFKSVSELHRLDPDSTDYTFCAAVLLQEMSRFVEAIDVIDDCAREHQGKLPPALEGLRKHLERQQVFRLLLPAIQSLKHADYSGARKALGAIDVRFAAVRDVQLFQAYARKLDGGGFLGFLGRRRGLAEVRPDGTYADRDRLQGLLVQDEIIKAKSFLGSNKIDDAEKVLKQARLYAPDYGFTCFLLAGCIFRRTFDLLTTGKIGDFQAAFAEMVFCQQLLKTAAEDPELTSVKELAAQVDILAKIIHEIDIGQRQRREDVRKVNAVISEFKAIMDMVKQGIANEKVFADVRSRLSRLRDQTVRTIKDVKDKEGRQALEQLIEIMGKHLDTMVQMKKDKGVIDQQMEIYAATMKLIPERGFTSRSAVQAFKGTVDRSYSQLQTAKRQVGAAEARKVLEQLEERYNQIRTKLDSL